VCLYPCLGAKLRCVAPGFQNAHTAGILAAYYGRLSILDWLLATADVNAWEPGRCAVCVECNPPQYHLRDSFRFEVTEISGWKTCPNHHSIGTSLPLWMSAIAGGQLLALDRIVQGRNAELDPFSPQSCFDAMMFYSCYFGRLEIVKYFHAKAMAAGLTALRTVGDCVCS
jgi:hypothetical protein